MSGAHTLYVSPVVVTVIIVKSGRDRKHRDVSSGTGITGMSSNTPMKFSDLDTTL